MAGTPLRESTSVHDFHHPPKTVIGELNFRSGDALAEIYGVLPGPMIRTTIRVAEMVKYSDNTFHALKVTFANEIGNLCKELKVDSHAVMEIFCQDTKLNISAAYLKPGFAFGGSCLPKDLRAIVYQAKALDLEVPVLGSVMASNQQQIQRAVEMVLKDSSYLGHHAEVQSHFAAFFHFYQPSHPQRVLYNRVQGYPANAIDGARCVFHNSVVFIGLIFPIRTEMSPRR